MRPGALVRAAAARAACAAAALVAAACALGSEPEPTPTVTHTPTVTATATPAPTATPMLPVEIRVGQLIMGGFSGTTADGAASLVRDYHVGNVTLLAENTGAPEQVLALTEGLQAMAVEANGTGMLISADQEGGRVIRLYEPFTQLPAAAVIGCIGETEFARQAGLVTATELRAAGVNMNLAPVADVLTNTDNDVIGDRSFSSDTGTVTDMVTAYITGLHQQAGVAATLKHFPGHGMTAGDSHDGRIVVEDPLDALDAHISPFRAVAGETDVLMTSNVDYLALDPAGMPASLSAPVMRYIRDDLGFDGVIITDALGMGAVSNRWGPGEAAVLAIEAGADMVLYSGEAGAAAAAVALADAVRSGRISDGRIAESYTRVMSLKGRLAHATAPSLAAVGSAEHAAFVSMLQSAAANRGC